jgi:soluble lytic murein transglycosylase-like protein
MPAAAELVILEDGRFLKATAYRVEGERMRVELLAGGALTLPLGRVSRVIDDEIEPPPPAPPRMAAVTHAGLVPWRFADGQTVPPTPFGEQIFAAAERHQVNPELVAALVRAESAFDPRAVSHKGAGGLMQLMPATARRFGLSEAERFDPERNLEAGTRYLRWLLDRFEGDVARALAAYNAGEGTVDRYGGVPPYRETRTYIRRIYSTLGMAESAVASLL